MSDELLVVDELHRDFGGVRAVNGVSFAVKAGGITGLIGPNGAGKSTVLTMIGGSLKPTAGSIRLRSEEVSGMPSHQIARRGVIRTFQISSEFPMLTVLENLLVAAPNQHGESLWRAIFLRRAWRREETASLVRARELLRRFGMADKEDDYAGNLSGGQKRLLELGRALMADPVLLLLDEPMAGVNPTLARRIEDHLLELCDEGLTMLMVEHELAVVERLCDPVVVMAQGRVIFQGSMEQVRSNEGVLDAYLAG